MRSIAVPSSFVCARCLRVQRRSQNRSITHPTRSASNTAFASQPNEDGDTSQPGQEKEEGAMARRLSQMSEENLETGGRSAVKAVEEAGFSEDLKQQLMDKIANSQYKSDNAKAISEANMPDYAGRGSRDNATARTWTGTESTEDAALRMLTDAHKPLRRAPKIPPVRGGVVARVPSKVDTGRPKSAPRSGVRIANARDKASSYESLRDSGLSEDEREKFRNQMKQRFHPGARATPATIQGLAALANERIEDAIARGQFKNLPSRGKKLDRDHAASNPFIDTTEYLMNKMIQRQEIVPPWIEKQQELVSTATRFRSRLRADWKRHVARVIGSRGGNVDAQIKLAEEYAYAEAIDNPPPKREEKLNKVDESGHVSQITLSGQLKVTSSIDEFGALEADEYDKVENEIKIMEQTFDDDGNLKSKPDEAITVSTEVPEALAAAVDPAIQTSPPRRPTVRPFRDPQWEQTEIAYLKVAVDNLNSLARSYNLMAPQIARKPYYYLERELKACFADVAPQIPAAIKERSLNPQLKDVGVVGHKPGGVFDGFSARHSGFVHDDRKPQYGFKEFWKDLFGGGKM